MFKLWVWTVSHCLTALIQTNSCFSHSSSAGTSAEIGSSSPGSQWEVNEKQKREKERPKPQSIVRKEHFETDKRKKIYINLHSPYHLTLPSRHHRIPNFDHKNLTTWNILTDNTTAHQVPKLGKLNEVK